MNVWIRRTRKESKCAFCEKPVINGDFQVVCQWFMKTPGGRIWKKRAMYHPDCWIRNAIIKLESKPVVETRGRRKAIITDPVRVKRLSLLQKGATVRWKMRQEIERGGENANYERIGRLANRLLGIREQLVANGGVPESWKEKNGDGEYETKKDGENPAE